MPLRRRPTLSKSEGPGPHFPPSACPTATEPPEEPGFDEGASTKGWRVGRRRRLSPARAIVIDLLHFSRRIPNQAITREFRLARLATLRKAGEGRTIGWTALFLHGYALLSCRHPVLRQCYMTWPWPHLYEHPHPVGRMTVSRAYDGEDRVFFAHVPRPDQMSCSEVQDWIDQIKQAPVESVKRFRQQIVVSRLPTVLRRPLWWVALNLSGGIRAEMCGTFGMTTVGSAGATVPQAPSIASTTFTFGPVAQDGAVSVSMTFDHRLLDGLPAAEFLRELEEILESGVANEVAALRGLA